MRSVAVTVAAGTRRMDLVLPGGVPAAMLTAELAPALGVEEPVSLTTLTGPLSPDFGLTPQGVVDGAVLWLAPESTAAPRVYDDPGEALAALTSRRVPGRSLLLRLTGRRQGDGPVDVPTLERDLRLLVRLQLAAVLLVIGAALAVLARCL